MERVSKIKLIDLGRLREVLDYDPKTGALIWRLRLSPRCKIGQQAGRLTTRGYRLIGIDGKYYYAHQLAWFHFYGAPPEDEIDHKNLNKDDAGIENLRESTREQNARNMRKSSLNSTGFKGVAVFNGSRNRKHFRAAIRSDGGRIFLGLFATPEEAYAVYCAKAKELHGEFARLE